jgi:D-beta-D-heptose 7-phosphate kinase/D-beta-D-heptose 1-phosphate adenosyltransferase
MRAADKVLARDDAAVRVADLRATRGAVVFTNGVFDVLHVGHVRYLEYARALGGMLVVGVNSDASVRLLAKGPDRPIVPQAERAEVVAALACVDFVCIFDEMRPDATILAVKPDIHVKSAQYRQSELPEAAAVAAVGGRIELAPHLEGRSTTDLVAKLRAQDHV